MAGACGVEQPHVQAIVMTESSQQHDPVDSLSTLQQQQLEELSTAQPFAVFPLISQNIPAISKKVNSDC